MANVALHEFIVRNREEIVRRVCQSVAGLAGEMDVPIVTGDFQALNRCLEDAIAGAITEHEGERNQPMLDGEAARGNDRLGFMAHEVRNLTNTAILACELLQTGNVAISGNTGAVLHRSLMGIRALTGRSLAKVHLTQRIQKREQFLVSGFIKELEPAATLEARSRGLTFTAMPVEDGAVIEADRQVLAAVVKNLLQNAFKFTRPRTTVTLCVGASAERVVIEVRDECGGLPAADTNGLRQPPERRSVRRTGLGLGLAFSRWGVEANHGRLSTRNLPEKGCVFSVDLPRLPVLAVAMP
jgi:signal transduction histidine kinase